MVQRVARVHKGRVRTPHIPSGHRVHVPQQLAIKVHVHHRMFWYVLHVHPPTRTMFTASHAVTDVLLFLLDDMREPLGWLFGLYRIFSCRSSLPCPSGDSFRRNLSQHPAGKIALLSGCCNARDWVFVMSMHMAADCAIFYTMFRLFLAKSICILVF